MPNRSLDAAPVAGMLASLPGRSGLLICTSTLLAMGFVAHHPVPAVQAGTGLLAAVDRIRTMDHIVHGGLIVLLLALMGGFAGFVDQVGVERPAMRLGLLAYHTGCLAGIAAALLDGFVIPDVARHFLAAPADEQKIAYDLIIVAGLGIQNLTRLAFVLMSAAMVAWGVVLLATGVRGRAMWVLGLLAGGVPGLVLVASGIILRPAELLVVLASQAVWNLSVGWALVHHPGSLRGR